jgi:hypothetical protein
MIASGDNVAYSAGNNIDVTNHVISGKDWSNEIASSTSGKLDTSWTAGKDVTPYSAGANIDVTNHVISGKDWTDTIDEHVNSAISGIEVPSSKPVSGTSGIKIEETENSVDMLDTPAEEEVSETDDAIDLFPVSDEISDAEQDDFSLEEELSVEEEDVEVLPEEPEVSENTQTDLLSEEPETFENLQTDLLSEDESSDINIGMELQEDENLLAEENSAPEIEDFSNPDTMLSDEQEEISPEEISVIDSEAEIFDDNNEVETLEPDMPGDDVVELDLNNDSFELSENSIDGAIDADTIQLQEEPSDIPYFGDEQDIQLAVSTDGDELTLEDNDMSIGLYAEEGQEETLTAVKEKAEPVFKSVDYSLFSFAPEEKSRG